MFPYVPLVKQALRIAEEAHRGQYDKGGYPYILHPITVAHACSHFGYTSETQRINTICTALLHDVFEDSQLYKIKDLVPMGFPHDVIVALKLLTHKRHIPYTDYIIAIAESNSLEAKLVKYADLEHNLNSARLDSAITDKDFMRSEKYYKAKAYIGSFLDP